jgi:predicted transcriptional regulator
MPKEAVFTMKLESELRHAFMAEAAAAHQPASQIVREMMRQYIVTQREKRDYEAFLHSKVDAARPSVHAGRVRSNDDVQASYAARRAALSREA